MPVKIWITYKRESDMGKLSGLSGKVFMAYYKREMGRSRNVMIVGFIVGGLLMLFGIARLLWVLGEVTWKR